MNTHQFITSKKGILLIILSVFFIVAITVTSLIASCGGEPEKKMAVTSSTDKLPSEQPQVVTDPLSSKEKDKEVKPVINTSGMVAKEGSEGLVDSHTVTSTKDKDREVPDGTSHEEDDTSAGVNDGTWHDAPSEGEEDSSSYN